MSRSKLTFLSGFIFTLLIGAGLLFAVPALAQAVDLNAFGQAAGFSTDLDIRVMIARLIRTAISFAGIILVIMIIYGGFMWMTSAGAPDRIDKAKKILTNAAIGLVIVIASFAITSFILGALTDAVGGGVIGEDDEPGFYPGPGGTTSALVLTSVNTQCASALKNLQLQMIFSKTIQEATVLDGGIRVKVAGGPDVPGTFTVNSRKVTFTPTQICPEDPNEYCFNPATDYRITLDPAILKSGSGTALTCNTVNPCSFDFTTGQGVDLSGPSVEVDAPESGQSLMVNNLELLQSLAQDDTGVSSVEFTVDGELIFDAGLDNSSSGALTPDNYFHTDDTQWNTAGYVTNRSYNIRARGFDCSGRSDTAAINAVLRTESCFNGIQDVDLGEAGIDCGGSSVTEYYCGACVGDQCAANEDCSSGVCENGFCVGSTIIERVNPGDGAVGNLITVAGRGFGAEPGSIVFLGADGVGDDFVVSAPYECSGADTWTDTQIIIQVQEGMIDGPIKIITAALDEDLTNDLAGPYLPDFVVNDIVRPGLCKLEPDISPANQEIRWLGNNFGAARGSSTAFYGNYSAASYANDWSETEFGAVAPLVNAGRYRTQVFVGDNLCSVAGTRCNGQADCPVGEACVIGRQGSNQINFQVLAEDSVAVPVITLVDSGWKSCTAGDRINQRCVDDDGCPGGGAGSCLETGNWGPANQYLSIFGSNFGNSLGTVRFVNNLGASANNGIEALGSDDFPAVCENIVYWRDNVITVKVPSKYLNDAPLEPGSHSLYVKRQAGTVSNQVEFYVVDDQPGPAICALVPSAGPTGSEVDVLGENFGNNNARVWFAPNQSAPGVQTNQTYATQVPAGAQTGNVFLANEAGYGSNKMPFTVGDCRDENICAPGEKCCANGTCQVTCPITDVDSNYSYQFFTGPVPVAPEVVQICDATGLGLVSPTPWSGHTRSQDICRNAAISASFRVGSDLTPIMDDLAFARNTLVEKCLNAACTDREIVAGSVIDTWASGFTWLPADPDGLEINTHYFVTLNGYLPEEDITAIKLLNGEYLQDDFVWEFTTANSDVPCSVGDLMVSPGQFTARTQDEQVKYLAQPLAAGNGGQCLLLSCREYQDQYVWNSSNSALAPLLPQTQTACGISAEAREETQVGDSITISSSIADPAVSGEGELEIHFTDPAIVSYWPNCESACVNAEIGARFNVDMSDFSFSLLACATEACINTELIYNYTLAFNHDTFTLQLWPDDPLQINKYYKVIFYPSTASTSGRQLRAVYGDAGFSWLFHTKNDPAFCGVDRVSVEPAQSKMRFIGQKQSLMAVPYGAPDNCSANGQILNAADYTWRAWTAADAPNYTAANPPVVAALLGNGLIPLSSELAPGCSSDCLHTGSAIQIGTAVCGDRLVDLEVEDCDDGNTLNGDGCSANCLTEGTDAPTCGNNDLQTGEECDDGNVLDGDGCSARCLREGAAAAGYTCGNRDIAFRSASQGVIGEECDDGNTRNGDGCSSQCLHEGSIPQTAVYATCGNNLVESGEDCDDGNLINRDGCSDRCLAEGTQACVYQCNNVVKNCTSDVQCDDGDPATADSCDLKNAPCCGNGGAPETGESCDDGNVLSGDGCSNQCLREGSSVNFTPASICGDNVLVRPSEACEAVGSLVSGPYAVVQMDEGAVEELLAAPADVYVVKSNISATVENSPSSPVSGTANVSLACVCQTDAQCGDSANYGCGTRGCCFERPMISTMYPSDGQVNVCRNTALWFEFDQAMDPASIQEGRNFFLKLVNLNGSDLDQTACEAAGYTYVASADHQPWLVRAWHWVKDFVTGFFGRDAAAALYQGCIVPNVSYSSEIVGAGSRLRINLNELLNQDAAYQIVALDDPNKADGLAEGLVNKFAVGLKAGSLATFRVGDEICSLDEVRVEDLGKTPFDRLNPSYTLFTKTAEVHRLQGAGFSFRNGVAQEIQPIDTVYDWTWSWNSTFVDDPADCPADDPATPSLNENANCLASADQNAVNISNPTAPDNNPTQADVTAQNQDGRESAYAIATITTNQHCAGGFNAGQVCTDDAGCPGGACVPEKIDGSLPLTVLLCSNPWPDANFPFVQSSNNSGNGRGPTNFGFYYCRDAGDPNTPDDDLPAMAIQEVAAPAVGDIYREFLFILEGTGDALGVRVMNDPNYLPPDMWFQQMGFRGSPREAELDGYQAVRDGNTIYALAANQTGDIFPNIYVISTTDDPSPEAENIFDQILNHWTFNANTGAVSDHNLCVDSSHNFLTDPDTGNFLGCQWDGDCPAPGICDADKAKLARDLRRLSDLVRIKSYITGTCSGAFQSCSGDEDCSGGQTCENLSVPPLAEGSFIRALSTSRWPSWNSVLGNALGQALPQDPLNLFSSCEGEAYDPETCFDSSEGQFICAQGSHIYGFNSSSEGAYTLTAQLEHQAAPWAYPIDPVLDDNAKIVAEYENYQGSASLGNTPAQVDAMVAAFVDFDAAEWRFYGNLNGAYQNLPNSTAWNLAFDLDDNIYFNNLEIYNLLSQSVPYDLGALNSLISDSFSKITQLEAIYPTVPAALAEVRSLRSLLSVFQASLVDGVTGSGSSGSSLTGGFQNPALFCSGLIVGDSSVCGDGIKAPNEMCEIGEVDLLDCPGGQKNVNCINDGGVCRFQRIDEAPGACQVFGCGNGVKEGAEECDDGIFNGSYGYCSRDCTTTPDFYCGDGYLAGGEQCDCGTVQNYSSLPGSSWAKSASHCSKANGQYVSDFNQSCAFNCTKPGPSCGDGLINGSEVCDPGNQDSNYQQESCGTFDSQGRERFKSRSCTGSCGWGTWSVCAPLSSCGDGVKNGTEQCDDGNTNDNDACTNACQLNVCGDGYINAGLESCDLGPQNGSQCAAAYDSICYYCNVSCQYQSRTGDFCGDGRINGSEFCDGNQIQPRAFDATTREASSVCAATEVNTVVIGNPRVDPPADVYSCRYVGICNGGDHNGEPCTLDFAGSVYTPNAGGSDGVGCQGERFNGVCVAPKCASNCRFACPFETQKASILVQSGAPGATPQESISLYPFLNSANNIPDRAQLFLPACRASVAITADIDKSDVQPPSVDVVFVTDLSGSMGGGNVWRINAVKEATTNAIDEMINSYQYFTSDLRIALISYSGYFGARIDSGFSEDQTALKTIVDGYITGGATPTPTALQAGIDLLATSEADEKILVLLSDGEPSDSPQGKFDTVVLAKNANGDPIHSDIKIFTAALTTTQSLFGFMKHVSNDQCKSENFPARIIQTLADTNGTTIYFTSLDKPGDCEPDGATEYGFQATDAAGVNLMYEAITNTVLGVSFAFVTDGPTITAGQAREGND
ncbi:DUF4215 domain-containing protein, partial [Patescibacteria group bacterium]|nr:DUF4215 domain-containing protein [Patescibacteria group bacterium]